MLKAIYVAAAIGLAGIPAQAAVMQAQYFGTVSNSLDWSGLFQNGTGNNVLDGLSAIVTFQYDTSQGLLTTDSSGEYFGGWNDVLNPHLISASIDIGGTVLTFPTSVALGCCNGIESETDIVYALGRTDTARYIEYDASLWYEKYGALLASVAGSYPGPNALEQELDWGTSNFLSAAGSFSFYDGDRAFVDVKAWAQGDLTLDRLAVSCVSNCTVVDPSPVPLPAALPLLAVALAGMTGLRLRRRLA